MDDRRNVVISSTSPATADVSPVCLRGGADSSMRLVFRPKLVDNKTNEEAAVHGVFTYQKRRTSEPWEDVQSIRLSELKAGEGVRLELHASELLQLYKALGALYDQYAADGIRSGDRRYVLVDAQSEARDLLDAATVASSPESVRAVIEWLNAQDPDLVARYFRDRGDTVAKLDSALGVARLENFIERANLLLNRSSEGDWQDLLKEESWALGQLYAEPVVIVKHQAYVGGKDVGNTGGNAADFLYRNALSDNCLLVEIKRSDTPLVVQEGDNTNRNRILNISRDLVGAAQQLLQYRYTLTQQYLALTAGEEPPRYRTFNPQMLLIVGSFRTLTSVDECKSFDLYRSEHRNLRIVCFDELVEKANSLVALLRDTQT